jgi:short-subunit dehydrogenase
MKVLGNNLWRSGDRSGLEARDGETALITGASSGIGAEFARQLAARQFHVVLVARRRERLYALASELARRYGIHAIPLAADLAGTAGVERVEQYVRACRQLTVLVNNAGFGMTGTFDALALQRHLDMLAVHVTASIRLCYAALQTMLQRQRGAIINVSSVAGELPVAGNVSYSASKAYLNVFTRGLNAEVRAQGLWVQALCPGYTYSEIHDSPDFADFDRYNALPCLLWMTPASVVACSLKALHSGRTVVIPGLHNRLLVAAQYYPLAGLLWRMLVRGARLVACP